MLEETWSACFEMDIFGTRELENRQDFCLKVKKPKSFLAGRPLNRPLCQIAAFGGDPSVSRGCATTTRRSVIPDERRGVLVSSPEVAGRTFAERRHSTRTRRRISEGLSTLSWSRFSLDLPQAVLRRPLRLDTQTSLMPALSH